MLVWERDKNVVFESCTFRAWNSEIRSNEVHIAYLLKEWQKFIHYKKKPSFWTFFKRIPILV